MEEKQRWSAFAIVCVLVLVMAMMVLQAQGCPSDGSDCRSCIVNRMKSGCPSCEPIMRCMARCLWGGTSRNKCIKKCDCNVGGYPRLSDCKKCLSQCKCSCSVS
ncbi:hypothetical protein LguiA_015178 [Lonicera macranthoides]